MRHAAKVDDNQALILAFDLSSTAIGWCVHDSAVLDHGVIRLAPKAPIDRRCLAAYGAIKQLLDMAMPDAVALESPVARFAKAVIPQCRISGVVLLALAEHELCWCEVTPTEAKKALVGDGDANKEQMLMAAAEAFGYDRLDLHYASRRGEWSAYRPPLWSGIVAYNEHEADALGVAMAAAGKVRVEAIGAVEALRGVLVAGEE